MPARKQQSHFQTIHQAIRLLLPALLAIATVCLLFFSFDLIVSGNQPVSLTTSAGGGDPVDLNPIASWLSNENDQTSSMAWGDVDGDGDLDLVVGNSPTYEFGCNCYIGGANKLYKNEDGVLALSASWVSSDTDMTSSVAWGDVDGDGDLDLAVGNSAEPNKLYKNEGGMLTISASWVSSDTDRASSVAWGDVDGDGDLDLVVGNSSTYDFGCNCYIGGANKLYKNEEGMLTITASWVSSGTDTISSVAWGDVDGDGDLDLAVGNRGEPNKLYKNEEGMLTISASWVSSDTDRTSSVAWGDVDGDGDLDLAVGNLDQPNKLYKNEEGMLTISASWVSSDTDRTSSVAWGDVDGDGDLDLAVGNDAQPNKLYQNGEGMLSEGADWQSSESDFTGSVAWGDVDGDGDLDLAVGNGGFPNKLYQNESRTLSLSTAQSLEDGLSPSVAWGDVDGDGDLDLAVGNSGFPNKLYQNEDGMLSEVASWQSLESDPTTSVAWGDVDADGDLDLAVGNGGPNRLYLNSEGTLSASWQSAESDSTQSIAWGDVDADGDLDLAVGNWNQPNKLYQNEGGTLTPSAIWQSEESDETYSVAWGDVDADGDLDLAVGNNEGPNKLYQNEGGTLTPSAIWQSEESDQTFSVAWGDVDADGDLDLAVGNKYQVNKLYQNEGGMLSESPSWRSLENDYSQSVAWGDVDGDGDLDLAVGNGGEPNKLYKNEDGTLSSSADWQSLESDFTESVAWGDVDADGDLDLAVGNHPGRNKLYLNQRPAHPHPTQTVAMNISTLAVAGANFYALSEIREGVLPISYTLTNPMREVRAFYSPDGGGRWLEAVATSDTITTNLSSTGEAHIYKWDILASGFFGQSDNVVLRLEGLPNLAPIANSIPGPFQRPFVSAQTYPFRVRGNQVQVLSETLPVKDAIVYRLPAEGSSGAEPIADNASQSFRTDAQGYLQGRGELGIGDTLFALLPISSSESYTLYHTNAMPTETGLEGHIVQTPGVQELVVSADNPLMLFDLDMSLEWDARNDGTFLTNLEEAIKRVSTVLYDVSNGQVAIGNVRLHQAKENWTSSNIVMYATNNIRPRANLGGIVSSSTDDDGLNGLIEDAYLPGQVRMGPNWDPFGENHFDLGQDWWRALAHELAHYLLFLPDNYIGISESGNLVGLDCLGSFMTNTYDDSYSEFLTEEQWVGDCLQSIAAHTTGRSDWETISTFYPMLSDMGGNPGPSTRPLNVTQVTFVEPSTDTITLPARYFDLRDAQSLALLSLPQAQGYLFKTKGTSDLTDDTVVALGTTGANGDRIKVRGAEVNDRLCAFDSNSHRVGCEIITELSVSLPLDELLDWQAEILATPVSSRTFAITATLTSEVAQLNVQVLPAYGSPITPTLISAPWDEMTPLDPANPLTFTQVITLPYPAFEAFVRIWVPDSTPEREAISQFYLSSAWGPPGQGGCAGCGDIRPWNGNTRAWGAPVASGDGQVTIFNSQDPFGETGTSALQALTTLPNLPPWLTVVGQAYRVALYPAGSNEQQNLTETITRTISFDYLQRDVPLGYEYTLNLYYLPDDGQTWQRLATDLDMDENQAASLMPTEGEGVYALISTITMPAFQAGWNLFGYPVSEMRPPSTALASIQDYYSSVYFYNPVTGKWKLHDNTVINERPEFEPLVNDLTDLEFGQSYWLYATEPITLNLAVPSGNRVANTEASLELPPATFYGPISATHTFSPTVGMPITASIKGTVCGQSTVDELDEQLVYKIQVAAETGNGCGVDNATITFTAGTQLLDAHVWNNTQAWYHPLGPTNWLYFPIIKSQ